jgi:hypothetical protein
MTLPEGIVMPFSICRLTLLIDVGRARQVRKAVGGEEDSVLAEQVEVLLAGGRHDGHLLGVGVRRFEGLAGGPSLRMGLTDTGAVCGPH